MALQNSYGIYKLYNLTPMHLFAILQFVLGCPRSLKICRGEIEQVSFASVVPDNGRWTEKVMTRRRQSGEVRPKRRVDLE